jgi:FkbM family methyltransferase
MTSPRTAIKKAFRNLGYEVKVSKYGPRSSNIAQTASSLRKFEIDLILDVGANRGHFASEIRSAGYTGNILSFEPLSKVHIHLLEASKGDPKWEVHPRCALGEEDGEVEINIAGGNSESSSVLPMLASHTSAAPKTAYIGKETVPLRKLDSVALEYAARFRNPFLKIDIQGFEWEALNGAARLLPNMRGALLELSLTPLYEGQHLWQELIARMEDNGMILWAIQPGFVDPNNGRTMQFDGIFFRQP